jgi:hypothetical protein
LGPEGYFFGFGGVEGGGEEDKECEWEMHMSGELSVVSGEVTLGGGGFWGRFCGVRV